MDATQRRRRPATSTPMPASVIAPGVLSQMHRMLSDLGANITAEYLRTDPEIGYVVLDVDPTNGKAVLERVRQIPETIRVRMLW